MNKKLMAGLIISVCLMAFVELSSGQAFEDTRTKQYVGNVNTFNYHCINCKEVKGISPDQKVMYNSAEEAVKAGCKPCNVCNPPTKD
jgi:Pyruvate/2-oxoacid:ferredoxin oxidoreductase delta subunit